MEIIFAIAILIMSVVVHEVSHGFVAGILGDPTAKIAGRLTLNPLKHLDPVGSFLVPLITSFSGFVFGWAKPVPYNPYNLGPSRWGPALVGVAGPGANLLIALIFSTLLRLDIWVSVSTPVFMLVQQIAFINIILAIFNLIPLPPLDGSKVLFSILPYRYHFIQEFLEKYQLLLILALIFFGWDIIISPIVWFFYKLLILV